MTLTIKLNHLYLNYDYVITRVLKIDQLKTLKMHVDTAFCKLILGLKYLIIKASVVTLSQ